MATLPQSSPTTGSNMSASAPPSLVLGTAAAATPALTSVTASFAAASLGQAAASSHAHSAAAASSSSAILSSSSSLSSSASSSASGVSLPSVLDRPLSRGSTLVSLSAFSYLFAEIVSYSQQKEEVEKRLHAMGYGIGQRALELLAYRSSIQSLLLTSTGSQSGGGGGSSGSSAAGAGAPMIQHPISVNNIGGLHGRREKSLISMLQWVHSYVWKSFFGRQADGLEKATDKDDEFYIYANEPITNRFISTPKEFQHLNCATFIAGMINGMLDAAAFPSDCSAHFNTNQSTGATRTVFVIRVEKEVLKREQALANESR